MGKKVVFSLALVLTVVGIFWGNDIVAFAKECTAFYKAPKIPQVTVNRGHSINLTTAADSCYGSNTEVWFYNFGSAPNDVVITPGATVVWVELYEEDPPGDDDEWVKEYAGFFSGKVLTEFRLVKTIRPGIIDSQGDQNCEFYMTFSLSGYTGGPEIPEGLFDYQMCMK